MTRDHDIIFVGCGLASGLAAHRLVSRRPDVRILVLESAAAIGRQHTWSFHESDLGSLGSDAWVQAFVSHAWDGYDVRFPRYVRQLPGRYFSIRSGKFAQVLTSRLGSALRLNAQAASVTPHSVTLADGEILRAACVIDGRGLTGQAPFPCGYQKFLGQYVTLSRAHGLSRPILMDATFPQEDGYRFFYVLPVSARELLIEDTCYGDTPLMDEVAMSREIRRYAEAQGWRIAAVGGSERGVLPIPWHGSYLPGRDTTCAAIGLAGGLFHPATGYSVIEALRFAERLAEEGVTRLPRLTEWVRAYAADVWRRGEFFRRLNNMLFHAAKPADRVRVMEKFYRHDLGLIQRFYAGRLSPWDRMALLSGEPPVPVAKGLRCFWQKHDALPAEG